MMSARTEIRNMDTLESATDEAIQYIKANEPEEGYSVAFSGGKDSIVVYDLVKRSGAKILKVVYSDTTIDPPELTRFIKTHYPEVIFNKPKASFFRRCIEQHMMPTRPRRWCCREFKERVGEECKNLIVGIRAEESWMRAKRNRTEFDARRNLYQYKPIFLWDAEVLWKYIRKNNLPYCTLYDRGFHRLGCITCPYVFTRNNKELSLRMKLWPKHFAALEQTFRKVWEYRQKRNPTKYGGIPWKEAYQFYLDTGGILTQKKRKGEEG